MVARDPVWGGIGSGMAAPTGVAASRIDVRDFWGSLRLAAASLEVEAMWGRLAALVEVEALRVIAADDSRWYKHTGTHARAPSPS